MGFRDKALLPLNDKPLIQHVIDLAKPQVNSLIISVNRNPELYRGLKLPLIADINHCHAGPLIGIYSAMRWFLQPENNNDCKYLACFAADVPSFPADCINSLAQGLDKGSAKLAYCQNGGEVQPLFSLWDLNLHQTIKLAIDRGVFGPKLLFNAIESIEVDMSSVDPMNFMNINSPQDLERAKRLSTGNHLN
jgi:molybdopterin-guanine dinucleotide biosynthesis protein A